MSGPDTVLNDLIGVVVDSDAQISHFAAVRARAVEATRVHSERVARLLPVDGRLMAGRSLVAEIGCALRLPERTAESLIGMSRVLVNSFPDTLRALDEGQITYRHACALLDQALSLDAAAGAGLEAALLPDAGLLTVSKFAERARRLRERLHPESITVRNRRSVLDRGCSSVRPRMVWRI